jgi:hypothetical protein
MAEAVDGRRAAVLRARPNSASANVSNLKIRKFLSLAGANYFRFSLAELQINAQKTRELL